MNENILEIKLNNCINPEILLKDLEKVYISTCDYDNDENILYTYDIKKNILEKVDSVDLETFFFCDEISRTIYKCKESEDELIIHKIYNEKSVCIYKEKLIENNYLADIYSINNNIFIKLQNDDMDIYESYLIVDNKKYKIDNKYFSDSINRPNYMKCKEDIFLVLDESNFETYEIKEIIESNIESKSLFNRITLYNLQEFVESVKNNKEISKQILIESECNKEPIKLLGIHKDRIIVFYGNEESQILIFDIKGNFESIPINYEIDRIIKSDELYYIYINDGQIGILNEKEEKIFSIENEGENERIHIVGVIDSKYVIYKKEYYEEERIETYIYDLISDTYLKYDSDFIFIKDTLI